MQSILVSIIIPIYKVEPYVERCIDSVLSQTYHNLEVILVDDCTPDRSMELAKEYVAKSPLAKDLSFIYLQHEHNRGLSAARNTGIDAAQGDYLYFLDCDDEITGDCIASLVKQLEIDDYDCVIGNLVAKGTDHPYFKFQMGAIFKGTEEILQSYLSGKWYPMAQNKLCRLSFLKKHSLYFEEGLIHEDELWSFQLACTLQTLCTVNHVSYIYYIRPNSIMTGNTIEKKILNCLKVLNRMYVFQEKNQLSFKEIGYLECNFANTIYNLLGQNHCSPIKRYIKIRSIDVRSLRTIFKMFKSAKDRIRNFDLVLPVFLGFCYKYMLWKFRAYWKKGYVPFY